MSNKGFITVDFIFAITISAVVIMMMFALSASLSMIEVAQYIAFSTARAHAAAADTHQRQKELANDKFNSYFDPKVHPYIATIFKNGWFTIDQKSLDIRGGDTDAPRVFDMYGQDNLPRMPREGIRFRFHANILQMNVPLIGSVADPNGDSFGTWVTGFLIREVSSDECRTQLKKENRGKAIMLLDNQRFSLTYSNAHGASFDDSYVGMEDNGC